MLTSKLVYNVDEFRRLTGLGRGTVYEAIRRGEIPAVRVGRRVLIPIEAVHNLFRVGRNQNEPGREKEGRSDAGID
ncbi:excisionase family DNA-binding protein [Thermodesulfitimonas autotrophica]|uniref:excisionase family DNA-binding protein n=1 Tax=Thermodesulfitimonas autotrophica TaxID=1894989 RepID=UPI002FE05CF3